MFNLRCMGCDAIWLTKTSEGVVCPACGSPSFTIVNAHEPNREVEKAVEKALDSDTQFGLDIEEAKATVAIAVVNLNKILAVIEQQRNYIKQEAKKFISKAEHYGFDLSKMDKFFDNSVEVEPVDADCSEYRVIAPCFLELDPNVFRPIDSPSQGYHYYLVKKLPSWLKEKG